MSFTTEEKISKLESKGWILETFTDSNGSPKINAKYFEPLNRTGKVKDTPLYNLIFSNRNELVRNLYYSSIGTQRELAQEFGLSPEEISYIKKGRTQKRTPKDGSTVHKEVNVGRFVRGSEDIRFHLMQIQDRPYSISLRKDSPLAGQWKDKINRLCYSLSVRTGSHYHAEFINPKDAFGNISDDGECIIYLDNIYPIYRADSYDYHNVCST